MTCPSCGHCNSTVPHAESKFTMAMRDVSMRASVMQPPSLTNPPRPDYLTRKSRFTPAVDTQPVHTRLRRHEKK